MQDPHVKKKLALIEAHFKAGLVMLAELKGEEKSQNAKIKGAYESVHGEEHVQKLIDKKLKTA